MGIEGIKKAFSPEVQKKVEVEKKKKVEPKTPLLTNTFGNSKLNGIKQSGSMMKHKIALANDGTNPAPVAYAKQTGPNPYENQSAEEIAQDRIDDYESSSNKKQSAEQTGELIADIATYDPDKAEEVSRIYLNDDSINRDDKDELAQEFTRALDDSQLEEIAETRDGQRLLSRMEKNLLNGKVHGDEAADADRLRNALKNEGLFLGSVKGSFPTDDGVSLDEDPNASAEDVSNHIKYETDEVRAKNEYINALHVHRDDPEWLNDFYSALGPDKAAELINTTTQIGVNGEDPEGRIQQVELIQNSLETLEENGHLNQQGMDALVNELNATDPYIASEIFGKSYNRDLQEMYVRSAISEGSDYNAANAMHVLNRMPIDNQNEILSDLDKGELDSFIEGAMVRQREVATFEDALTIGIYSNNLDNVPEIDTMQLGGVEQLLANATERTFQHYPYHAESPFSDELKANIFDAAITGLNNDDAFENLKDNVEFKEELAGLFNEETDNILQSQMVNNDLPPESIESLSKFVELTLFTPPFGDGGTPDLDKLPDTLSGIIGDLVTDARENGNTNSARIAGELLGIIDNAAERAQDRVKNDKASRDKFIDTIVGLAFDLIPFPGVGKLGKGGSAALQRALGGLEGILKKETLDRIENMTASEAKKFLAEELKGNDDLKSELQQQVFSDLLFEARDQVGAGIDANDAAELRGALEGAYTFVDEGNEGNNPKFE